MIFDCWFEQISHWTVITSKKSGRWIWRWCLISLIKCHKVLHNGGEWYSHFIPIREIYMFCSQTHYSISKLALWTWIDEFCKACFQAQNNVSQRYLILPFIRNSKRLDGKKISFFAPFPSCPWASNSIFHHKFAVRKKRKSVDGWRDTWSSQQPCGYNQMWKP